jgi:hypothetical protein
MKISVTVNLGNYENIKIESSDYVFADDCKNEISKALKAMRIPQADDFTRKYFR